MTRTLRLSGVVAAAALVLCGAAAAQEPPDSLRRAREDTVTLSPEEALRARQRERLQRLSRAPGVDTVGLRELADTLAAETAARGRLATQGRQQGTMAADSVIAQLLGALPGYDAIEYQGRSATYDAATGDLFLYGDTASRPTVRYQGQVLSADSIIHFRQPTETIDACCETTYVPLQGNPVQSERLVVDTRTQEASAFGAETEYDQGARWKVFGDLPRVRSEIVFGSHARFTSCDLEVPHYHFETDELKIVRGSVLVARPVRLYFGDVPVAWLPFVAQSLSEGRASGLLTPRFSVNDIVRTSGGYSRRISNVGFYWAMNDYMDGTFAFDWFSDNFTSVTAGIRYSWLRQFMNGGVNVRQYWREAGSTKAVDANHSWEISERTRMNASVSYASSEFVRQYSFNPFELTQQIQSSGGLSHRFDWGNLSLSGNRTQSISDDRVSMTLPNASLSLNPITLFPAATGRSSWFNNMTWSGGARFDRQIQDFPDQPADSFRLAFADQGNTTFAANHSLNMGNLFLSQNVDYREGTISGMPRDSVPFFPALMSRAEAQRLVSLPSTVRQLELVDVAQSSIDWNTSLGYQQRLVGSTTLTPRVSLSGRLLRSDTIELAQSFVSGPARVSFGAELRSDVYGFYPGVGAFEAIRHKVSPSFSYEWAPEATPTELQRRVLGATTAQRRSAVTVGISQTFEAKRRETADRGGVAPDSLLPPAADTLLPESLGQELGPQAGPGGVPGGTGGEPRRRQQGQVVNLLSLRTSALSYDFVEADSAGEFLLGFRTTSLRNEVSSDYLRGLTVSFEHDLFRDSLVTGEGGTSATERAFQPHLSSVNLGFSLNGQSSIFRWLGLGRDPSQVDVARAQQPERGDPFAQRSVTDETSIIPGRATETEVQDARRLGGPSDWDATFSYSLVRPREGARSFFNETTQTLQIGLNMSPTPNWDMSWRTSYDLEAGRFSDHIVTLTRDLHRWQANFDFMKTATGNWSFRFEVSLLDNQDLKFDYQQRNLETTTFRDR